MNNQELKNKIDALCADKEFCEKMSMCGSVEELANLFAENGIEVDPAVLEAELANAKALEMSGELSEDDLNDVTGGIFVSGAAFLTGAILYSIGCIGWAVYCASRRR